MSSRRSGSPKTGLAIALAILALVFLNVLFSFENQASTPWPRLHLALAIETPLLLLVLSLLTRGPGQTTTQRRRRHKLFAVTASCVALVFIRALVVTSQGVLGRRFDLYGDLPHLGNVASMMAEDGSVLLVMIAGVLWFALLAALIYAALFHLERLLQDTPNRTRLQGLAVLLLVLVFAGSLLEQSRINALPEPEISFDAEPGWDPWQGRVEQAAGSSRFLIGQSATAMGFELLGDLRAATSRLDQRIERARTTGQLTDHWNDLVAGPLTGSENRPADILLIFLESYGATLIDDEQHWPYIEEHFAFFERELRESQLCLRSIRTRSPTFGGGSWRAHATLQSGLLLDNQHLYEQLLDSNWRSLSHHLKAAGYRTVAFEPGIREAWPEAEYWQLDKVYDAAALTYRGPPIGWWKIPDQFTLYQLWRDELQARERKPVFAKVSLILTHIPYTPIPPYVEDWKQFETTSPYEAAMPSVAADDWKNLTELSIRYVAAFRAEWQVLIGFLRELTGPNTLVIVAGDHQPPKLATHDSTSWNVPLHVLSKRCELVKPFSGFGFSDSLKPEGAHAIGMEEVLPVLYEALSGAALEGYPQTLHP